MKAKFSREEWEILREVRFGEGVEIEVEESVLEEYRRLYHRFKEINEDLLEKVWEAEQEAEEERSRIQLETVTMRAQARPYRMISNEEREVARAQCSQLMKQYVMPLTLGEPPEGVVYADSPLRERGDEGEEK